MTDRLERIVVVVEFPHYSAHAESSDGLSIWGALQRIHLAVEKEAWQHVSGRVVSLTYDRSKP